MYFGIRPVSHGKRRAGTDQSLKLSERKHVGVDQILRATHLAQHITRDMRSEKKEGFKSGVKERGYMVEAGRVELVITKKAREERVFCA